ncbi:hypothetical protein JOQ06_013411 [Pogonophryne albipinna]|uniref:Uncharacterized protein n=1 Tax=Pogonophryne albipinna TaxID=1090488 RepID=A0AAD6FTH5_9TELE|nr:hypothetical protein JOQ06_013411 [Pogonophryne albipinna]
MAAANYLQAEDQFLCSICLDVFTDPVTTSCGHNFCKNCITEHWDKSDQYQCPMSHPYLILSGGGKQVSHGDVKKNLPDNPERFSDCLCVLGKQSFSSGRFYFEVQVKGKTGWTLGVARESINRKEGFSLSPQCGNWTLRLTNGNVYKALDDLPVLLSLKSQPQKVGVFVDYEEGLVSFYDVDAAALIYSFTGCSFTEKLFPFFGPGLNDGGQNSAPLIISPVRVN